MDDAAAAARLHHRRYARKNISQYGFDLANRPDWVSDNRNLITESPTTGLGDAQLISPDTGSDVNVFDAGVLIKSTDARGAVATFDYDELDQLKTVTAKLGAQTLVSSQRYDETGAGFSYGIGWLTSTETSDAVQQLAYDPSGRVVRDAQQIKALAAANPAAFTSQVDYSYDATGSFTPTISTPRARSSRPMISCAGAGWASRLATPRPSRTPRGWVRSPSICARRVSTSIQRPASSTT